ncbi:MAG: DUF5671 domain-containing protein [Parcubacteria group bacterium]
MKIAAKDFFFQLGAMAALYAGAIALLNLLFRVINSAFPPTNQNYISYAYYGSPISLPVATLIVVLPLFLTLSWSIQQTYEAEPALREAGLRRWLVFITLFVAGVAMVADLVTILYYFLDGQDITTAFLLKGLSVLVVAGSIFGYFLTDLRGGLTRKNRMIWRAFAILLVLGSIIAGFVVMGSPATQRSLRQDSERVMNLENIQWQIINYWQSKNALPENLSGLTAGDVSGWVMPVDPETGSSYEYERTSDLSFHLCANFNLPTAEYVGNNGNVSIARPMMAEPSIMMKGISSWHHEAGRQCFERTIDPDFYPPNRPR